MITFPAASLEDIDVLCHFSSLMNDEDGHAVSHDLAPIMKELIQTPALGALRLVKLDDTSIGFYALCYGYSIEYGGRDCCLDEIYILKDYRGNGYGRMATENAIKVAKEAGCVSIYLEVMNNNIYAQKIYESQGFEARGSMLMAQFLS